MSGKTKVDIEKLKMLHSQGKDINEMVEILGFHRDTILAQLFNLKLKWVNNKDKRRKISKEDELSLIDSYKSGKGATTVAKELGITKKTVYNILNKHGVGTRSVKSRRKSYKKTENPRITLRDLHIAELHDKGYSPREIAKELDMSDTSVRYSLSKQDLYDIDDTDTQVRQKNTVKTKGLGSGNREAPLDPHLTVSSFDLLYEESMYWIGFLLADGSIRDNQYGQPTISINLKESDYPHLEKLKSFVGTERPIRFNQQVTFDKMRRSCKIAWRCRQQADALRKYGVVSHKEGRFVNPALASSISFWRGLVDGDGCVYYRDKGSIYLSGQPSIIAKWVEFCENVCQETDIVRTVHRESVSIGEVRFKRCAKIVIEKLYRGSNISLSRKYEIARTWWESRENENSPAK